jgi:hypothetical protein
LAGLAKYYISAKEFPTSMVEIYRVIANESLANKKRKMQATAHITKGRP